MTAQISTSNNKTAFEYDHNSHLIEMTYPSGKKWKYIWNEAGNRSSEINPANNAVIYGFDSHGMVESRKLPLGQVTRMKNKRGVMVETDLPGGQQQTWQYNYFKILQKYTNLSGVEYHYEHDYKQQLIHQYSIGLPRMGSYLKLIKTDRDDFNHIFSEYMAKVIPLPEQDVRFSYDAGLLTLVADNAQQMQTKYGYDITRFPIHYELSNDERGLLRHVDTRYNAINLMEWTFDTVMFITTGFDGAENRRFITAVLDLGGNTEQQKISQWNTFDRANRPLISGGELIDGTINISSTQGMSIAYQNNLRKTETYDDFYGTHVSTLYYDSDEQLEHLSSTDGFWIDWTRTKEG